MPQAPSPLSLRLGHDGLGALDAIARRRGITRAEAARQAIAETAERDRRRGGLAAEARALMENEEYVREAREVDERETLVLCEMVGAVDGRNLGERVGHLTHEELGAVEEGLALVLDLA